MVSYRTTEEHAAGWGAASCQRQQPSRTTGTAPRATAKTRSKKLDLLQCKVFLQISDSAMPRARGVLSRPHAKRGTKNTKKAAARDKLAAEAATAATLAAAEAMADLASPGAQQQTTPATGMQRPHARQSSGGEAAAGRHI